MIIKTPDILIPKEEYDYNKWAVVACDQFTSQKDYWNELDQNCGDISALRIIFPEVFLGNGEEERIANINSTMQEYLDKGIYREIKNSFILTERVTSYNNKRIGLVIAVDVEQYDYKPLTNAPIKATERTVEERLPVRVQIRKDAPLETPHIMLLMDDIEKSIIEPLYEKRKQFELLYDVKLNMNGGHIRGYKVPNADEIIAKIMRLIDKDTLLEKYNRSDNPFLFAVGDGNHSLATAKACWDKIKDSVGSDHPARYALCELVNLYEDDLVFEPIHRVMFNVNDSFIDELKNASKGNDITYIEYKGKKQAINVSDFKPQAIAEIQEFLDRYIKDHEGVEIDYIHGEEHTRKVALDNGGVAIFMPTIEKKELFQYVLNKGVLCRKAFSMGEAEEKRYYIECKKIKE